MPARVLAQRPPERPLLLSIDLRSGRITAVGELDRLVAHRLSDALHALSVTGHRSWTIDAAGITFCDAEGLRALAGATTLAEERGCTLRLVAASPFTVRLLRLTGLSHLVDRAADRSPLDAA
ncbi:STAS domain-containing protein [Geodermatophilus chilensis]|uniref:STAS domain-containing protein n=1 Tax=Geodermatophilus chilensis TaxID=2035835 RepID=UPI0012FFE78C|nr:STAS domain-containing protein [Geodermatophilus chilensis]